MSNARGKVRLFVAALTGAVALGGAASVLAWFESTPTPRLTNSGDKLCIDQLQAVTHSGPDGNFKITVRAATVGFKEQNYLKCAPESGYAGFIKGSMLVYLLKLDQAGSGSNPDTYSICWQTVASRPNWAWNINEVYEWPSAPCGEGYYALATLLSVNGLMTDWSTASVGGYIANFNDTSTYNVSHHWHPALPSGATDLGPPVKLN